MKFRYKFILACITYAFLIFIGYWTDGTGIKDKWDDLMIWAKK